MWIWGMIQSVAASDHRWVGNSETIQGRLWPPCCIDDVRSKAWKCPRSPDTRRFRPWLGVVLGQHQGVRGSHWPGHETPYFLWGIGYWSFLFLPNRHLVLFSQDLTPWMWNFCKVLESVKITNIKNYHAHRITVLARYVCERERETGSIHTCQIGKKEAHNIKNSDYTDLRTKYPTCYLCFSSISLNLGGSQTLRFSQVTTKAGTRTQE